MCSVTSLRGAWQMQRFGCSRLQHTSALLKRYGFDFLPRQLAALPTCYGNLPHMRAAQSQAGGFVSPMDVVASRVQGGGDIELAAQGDNGNASSEAATQSLLQSHVRSARPPDITATRATGATDNQKIWKASSTAAAPPGDARLHWMDKHFPLLRGACVHLQTAECIKGHFCTDRTLC